MNFKEILEEKTKQVDEIVKKYLPGEPGFLEGTTSPGDNLPPGENLPSGEATIIEAMRYSVEAGGKRIRPTLLLEVYRLFGGVCRELVEPFAAAIEMVHTYSLVHDDLPAMDNDDYRRGRKTTHKVYGEAMGILAGDGLLNLAFETAAETLLLSGKEKEAGRAMWLLAKKPGISGMLGGQAVDIWLEHHSQEATLPTLLSMYEKKTGALISCAMEIGCVLAGGSVEEQAKIAEIARQIGLAFQIRDDILDVEGEEEKLGKPLGSDERNQKTTSVTLLGIEGAQEMAKELSDAAIKQMRQLEEEKSGYDGFLSELIRYLLYRDH